MRLVTSDAMKGTVSVKLNGAEAVTLNPAAELEIGDDVTSITIERHEPEVTGEAKPGEGDGA